MMAWPIVTLAIKIVSMKFLKSAAFGLARYSHRIWSKKHNNSQGEPLSGKEKLKHVITTETKRKDNTIFLLLMFGNFFFGFQELCLEIKLWCSIYHPRGYCPTLDTPHRLDGQCC